MRYNKVQIYKILITRKDKSYKINSLLLSLQTHLNEELCPDPR